MLIFADLKSKKYKNLEEIGNLPIIGVFFILLFSIFPGIILFFFDLSKELETTLFYSISALWCFILTKTEIHIKLFFLPAWILLIVLSLLTSI